MLSTIQKLLLAFVTLIVGLVFISQVAVITSGDVTTKKIVSSELHTVLTPSGWTGAEINESKVYTLTYAPTGWQAQDCPITGFVLTNASGDEFTETTDYVLDADAGTYTLVNGTTSIATISTPGNTTYASYRYCGDQYLNSDWQISVLQMVSGFFAIALLIFSVGMFYSLAKDAGIV